MANKSAAQLALVAASGNVKVALTHLSDVIVGEIEGTTDITASSLDNVSHAFDHLRAARALLQVPVVIRPRYPL